MSPFLSNDQEEIDPEVKKWLENRRSGVGTSVAAGLGAVGDALSAFGGAGGNNTAATIISAEDAKKKELRDYLEKKRVGDQDAVYKSSLIDKAKSDADIARKKLEKGSKGGDDESFTQEEKLRSGFRDSTKTFSTVRDQYSVIRAAAEKPSAAGDLSLIFSYMKLVDPGSTVREGEFANAQNAAGVPERIRNVFNRVVNGERLSPATRADFVGQAGSLYKAYEGGFNKTRDAYSKLAEAYGLKPENVIEVVVQGDDDPTVSNLDRGDVISKELPIVNTQEAYDALPKGAEYIDSKGKKARKK